MAPVRLQAKETEVLETMVSPLVCHARHHFEEYLQHPLDLQDPSRWHEIRDTAQPSFAVYHQVVKSPPTTCSACSGHQCLHQATPTTMPPFVATGTVPGTIQHALYGLMTPTSWALQLRNQLFPDGMVDGVVLATMEVPTGVVAPCTSLTVNWSVKSMPNLVLHKLIHDRDFVYLDATGFTTMNSTGETIGFHLKHSIELTNCLAATKTTTTAHQCATKLARATIRYQESFPNHPLARATVSTCTLFRQVTDDWIQVFTRAQLDPMEKWNGFLQKWIFRIVAQSLRAYSHASTCGTIKQLSGLVQCRACWNDRSSHHEVATTTRTGFCKWCGARSSRWTKLDACGLCMQLVCSRCSCRHKIGEFACQRRPRVRFRHRRFCAACLQGFRATIDAELVVTMPREESYSFVASGFKVTTRTRATSLHREDLRRLSSIHIDL